MAKKTKVNKTQEVTDYLKAHPQAKATEISQALGKKGIKITPSHVANIKSKLKRLGRGKKAKKVAAPVEAPAPVVTEAPAAKTNGVLTIQHVKAVAQLVKSVGGFERTKEVLATIREVGGMKKFVDLMEAMEVTQTDALVP
jgi:hypothetical protein